MRQLYVSNTKEEEEYGAEEVCVGGGGVSVCLSVCLPACLSMYVNNTGERDSLVVRAPDP